MPVTRKRLLAPECVLFFGISLSLLVAAAVAVAATAAAASRQSAGLRPRSRDRGSRSGRAPSSGRPVRRRARRRARRAPRPRRRRARRPRASFSAFISTLASAFFLCGPSTMIMLRPSCFGDDSTKPSSVDVLGQLLQQPEAQLGAVLLTTAEHDRDLDLVAGPQEPHDVTLLGLVVVRVDLRTKLHLLDDHVRLVPTRLTGLLGVLVLELPVVHELADGRLALRRDLDQVEVGLLGELQGLVGRDDADGLAVGSDESDLGNPDPVVDTQLGADVSSSGVGRRSLRRRPRRCRNNKGFRCLQAEASRDASHAGDTTEARSARRTSCGPVPSGPDPTTCGAGRSMRVGDDGAEPPLVDLLPSWVRAELIGQRRMLAGRFRRRAESRRSPAPDAGPASSPCAPAPCEVVALDRRSGTGPADVDDQRAAPSWTADAGRQRGRRPAPAGRRGPRPAAASVPVKASSASRPSRP